MPHHAPLVQYPVQRSPWLAAILLVLALAGALALAAWALWGAGTQPGVSRVVVALTWLVACGLAARNWWTHPQGWLVWTGTDWRLQAGVRSMAQARMEVHGDWLAAMGVRLVPHGGRACWLWLDRSAQPASWKALRRAVYSRASLAQADPGDGMPSKPSPTSQSQPE